MRKLAILSLMLLPINVYAEWVFVAESTGDAQGRGKGDITYLWTKYYQDQTKGIDYREFKILIKHKDPLYVSRAQKRAGLKGDVYKSSIAYVEVYCNQPKKIFMGKTEYYQGIMGTDMQDSFDYNQWIDIPSYTPAAIAVRKVC